MKFNLKNLFKSLSFILVVTIAVYFAIDTIHNKQNIMSFEDYDPPSSLIVEGEVIKKAKFRFIDVHSHLWNMPLMDLNELVAEMDEINMGYIVNLSGSGFGPQTAKDLYFDESTENFWNKFAIYVVRTSSPAISAIFGRLDLSLLPPHPNKT